MADAKFLLDTDVDDTPADAATTDPISSNWAYDHADLGSHGEIRLIPKSSSASTTEGTMFYDSDDNSIWVATE